MLNDKAQVVATAEEYASNRINADFNRKMVEDMLKNGPSMELRFPTPILQTDSHTIAVPLKEWAGQMFDKAFVDMLEKEMGRRPSNLFLDDMADHVMRKLLLAQVH